jgi:hypothetical protein
MLIALRTYTDADRKWRFGMRRSSSFRLDVGIADQLRSFREFVLMRAVKFRRVLPIGSKPMAASFCWMSGSAITRTVSR